MKTQVLIILVVVALVLSTFWPVVSFQGRTTELCQPGQYGVKSRFVRIQTLQGSLPVRYYFPDHTTGGPVTDGFAEGELPAAIILPGTNTAGDDPHDVLTHDATGIAADLAKQCYVTMTVLFRGQGPHNEVDTMYTWMAELELDDISTLITEVKSAPGSTDGDLVYDSAVGLVGFSQGADGTWMVTAENTERGRFRVGNPYDGYVISEAWMLPGGCVNGHFANRFTPGNFRTPWPTVANAMTPTTTATPAPGVSWNPTVWPAMATAYVGQHPPAMATLEHVVATRQAIGDELAASTPGTPYPHIKGQVSPYDGAQEAQAFVEAFQTLVPTSAAGTYPYHSLYIGPGAGSHSDAAWLDYQSGPNAGMFTDLRNNARQEWLRHYLTPAYASSPTPVGNTPTPMSTPAPFEYVVDSYHSTPASTPVPTFDRFTSAVWPPANSTPISLYLYPGGTALPVTPSSSSASETIGQNWDESETYNMASAVAETPAFGTLRDDILSGTNDLVVLTKKSYVSPILEQDVVLVAPPEVRLFADPTAPEGQPIPDTYQVHVRVADGLTPSIRPVLSQAHACAWDAATEPGIFNGTPFDGSLRLHQFKAGKRIVIEVISMAEEIYWTARTGFTMTPYMGDFQVKVYMQSTNSQHTSVTLDLVPTNAAAAIFPTPGGLAPATPESPTTADAPVALPVEVQLPLTLDYELFPDFTNEGNWRIWTTKASFTCTGGEGEVSCPADTALTGDGINQTFTFTATDSANNTDTVVISDIDIDMTPPALTANLPASQPFCTGATHLLDFNVTDNLSGVESSEATFNGIGVVDNQRVNLVAGPNSLVVDSVDVANNAIANEAVTQVNYDETLDFPPNGGNVNPLLPLNFEFKVNDACAPGGNYGNATGTLWLTGPDGVEIPAEWFGLPSGNVFSYNALTGWYAFDADLTGLASGTWTARAHLDDGNDYTVTFVIPGGLGGETAEGTATTTVRPACQDGWLPRMIGAEYCR